MVSLTVATTPPPEINQNSDLPTPPLTGGSGKRVRFADDVDSTSNKRIASSFESSLQDFQQSETLIPLDAASPKSELEPFNFTGLPKEIRNRIYKLLLTVPALVCIRQNRTTDSCDEALCHFRAEQRDLLPGIAFVITQDAVHGQKTRFHRSSYPSYINVAILRTSKKILVEAKPIMYHGNMFELANLNEETSPPANFTVPLFPLGYQRNIRRLVFRANAMYGFRWLMNGGYSKVKNYYRGLESLMLVLELESEKRGHGKRLARQEHWIPYVERVKDVLRWDVFGGEGSVKKTVPEWMHLRVLFPGDRYREMETLTATDIGLDNAIDNTGRGIEARETQENAKRCEIKVAVAEAFESFKKGGRK